MPPAIAGNRPFELAKFMRRRSEPLAETGERRNRGRRVHLGDESDEPFAPGAPTANAANGLPVQAPGRIPTGA